MDIRSEKNDRTNSISEGKDRTNARNDRIDERNNRTDNRNNQTECGIIE